jgi:hypothetical protein
MRVRREVILSGSRPDVDSVEWIKLNKWGVDYRVGYSEWCQKKLHLHFDTKFVLIWQYDGFALNPDVWRGEFLDYDYIGAPWNIQGSWVVGNGGFSLRSKRFCEEITRIPDCGTRAEDIYFCHDRRDDLIARGIRFAPHQVADAWATDCRGGDVSRRFGFHAWYLMKDVAFITNRWINPLSGRGGPR